MNEATSDLKRRAENVSAVALLFLFAFGAFTHFYASMKCQYGVEAFRIVNRKTEASFAVWSFVNENLWILIIVPLITIGGYLAMRMSNLSYPIRFSALGLSALLVLWYSWTGAYLGGKFLNY